MQLDITFYAPFDLPLPIRTRQYERCRDAKRRNEVNTRQNLHHVAVGVVVSRVSSPLRTNAGA